jgi:hypothetical protein
LRNVYVSLASDRAKQTMMVTRVLAYILDGAGRGRSVVGAVGRRRRGGLMAGSGWCGRPRLGLPSGGGVEFYKSVRRSLMSIQFRTRLGVCTSDSSGRMVGRVKFGERLTLA